MRFDAYAEGMQAGMDFVGPSVVNIPISVRWSTYNADGRFSSFGGYFSTIPDNTKDQVVMPYDGTDDGRQRIVQVIEFFNSDASNDRSIEFRRYFRVGGASATYRALVPSLGTLRYEPTTGWVVYNANGVPVAPA